MNKHTPTALLAAMAILFAGTPARAGGPTMHLAQASYALDRVEVVHPDLYQILADNRNAYLNGANFPDAFNPLNGLTQFFYETEQSHSAWFLTHYADYVYQQKLAGTLDDALLAHFMGTMAHIIGDWRFDRCLLPAVTRNCFASVAAQGDTNQVWTDIYMDWMLAPLRTIPASSGIFSPTSNYVPYAVGHQWYPGSNDPSILELAYPGSPTIPYAVLELGAQISFEYIENEPPLALVASALGQDTCAFALDEWDTMIGGANDGADAIAAAINRTWTMLQAGQIPTYEEYGDWPNVGFSMSRVNGGSLEQLEVGAWIEGPSDVTRLELEGNRMAALEETAGGNDRILIHGGYANEGWQVTLETPFGVADFQLAGERAGVLLENGTLLVNVGVPGSWTTLARGVLEFQLEGERVAVLAKAGGAETASPMSTPATNVVRVKEFVPLHVKSTLPDPPWTELAGLTGEPVQFQIEGRRIAVRTREQVGGQIIDRLLASEAVVLTGLQWTEVWSDTHAPGTGSQVAFALEGDRVGLLVDGTLSVLEGALGSPGVTLVVLDQGVAEFQLAQGYIAALGGDQVLRLLAGELDAPWVPIHADVAEFRLAGLPKVEPVKPWLGYSLLDGTLLTNRDFAAPTGGGYPESHVEGSPVYGQAIADFEFGFLDDPFVHASNSFALRDRLAILVENQVYFQELPFDTPASTLPKTSVVSLVPSDGVLSTWIQMNWTVSNPGSKDFVALYYADPVMVGATEYITGQWQWAVNGSSWVSNLKWRAGYWMAYIHEDEYGAYHIIDKAGPTGAGPLGVSAFYSDGVLQDWVGLGWDMAIQNGASTAGVDDFVALYDEQPELGTADADTYLTGQWEWAVGASPGVTSTPWAAGYYVGYVQEDHAGVRKVIARSGPTTVGDVSVSASVYPGLTDNWIQIDWSVTHPGNQDFVALYTSQPTQATVMNFVPGEYQWAETGSPTVNSSWASGIPWAKDYWVGYVQIDAKGGATLRASWGPTVCSPDPVASAWMSNYYFFPFYYFQLNWSISPAGPAPGPRDYVALYASKPVKGGELNYVAGSWQWASNGTFYKTWTILGSGYYIAYIHEDDCGELHIVDWSGPTP